MFIMILIYIFNRSNNVYNLAGEYIMKNLIE